MTLYLKDSYQKEFDATVESVKEGKFIVLDNTLFYSNSGGQPHDTGTLTTPNGVTYKVVYVGKFGGKISHEVDKEGLKPGDKVHGVLDWQRRYTFMRMHTAAHLLSAIIYKKTGALITGNQLGEEKSRIDFSLEEFDRDILMQLQNEANQMIEEKLLVNTKIIPRKELETSAGLPKLAMGLPESVKEVRLVEIPGLDVQPCGGTHVKTLAEIGKIEILKAENKGKNNRRVYFKVL
jgi:misacylated tRNA(Ala) deacylase